MGGGQEARRLCWIFNEDKSFKEVLIRPGKCSHLKAISAEGLHYPSDSLTASLWNGERKGCLRCSATSHGAHDCHATVERHLTAGRYPWCWILSLNELGEVEYELVFEFAVVVSSWILVPISNYTSAHAVLNLSTIGKQSHRGVKKHRNMAETVTLK